MLCEIHSILNAEGELKFPKRCRVEQGFIVSFVRMGLIGCRYLGEGEVLPLGAIKLIVDSQGFIKIPAHLLKRARIIKEVVLLMNQTYLEVWSEPVWSLEMENINNELDSKAIHADQSYQRKYLGLLKQVWPNVE